MANNQASNNLFGIVLIAASTLLFTAETTAAKLLPDYHPAQLGMLRSLGSLSIVFVILLGRRALFTTILSAANSNQIPLHLLRGVLSAVGLWCYFFAFQSLQLAEATVISYTKALFLVILAYGVLREWIPTYRWVVVIIGLVGLVIMLQPNFQLETLGAMAALVSAILGAVVITTTKILSRTDDTTIIMVYISVITLVCNLVPGILYWQTPNTNEAILLFCIIILGPLAQWLGILGFKFGEASALAPIDYLRVIAAALLGYLLFNEMLGLISLIGASLIIASIIYLAREEAKA